MTRIHNLLLPPHTIQLVVYWLRIVYILPTFNTKTMVSRSLLFEHFFWCFIMDLSSSLSVLLNWNDKLKPKLNFFVYLDSIQRDSSLCHLHWNKCFPLPVVLFDSRWFVADQNDDNGYFLKAIQELRKNIYTEFLLR